MCLSIYIGKRKGIELFCGFHRYVSHIFIIPWAVPVFEAIVQPRSLLTH